ncbi:hypothetical protein BBP40_008876 [Aspergillus hancockii]|nr:hypothetical protein BBP40_008876 [Aspergillus hancockii]
MSTPRSILVIGGGELGTYILQALAHHPHRQDHTIISVLLPESSINATEPSKSARISSLRKLGTTFTPDGLIGDSEEKLSSILKEFEIVICCTGYMAQSGLQIKISKAVIAASVPYYIPWQFEDIAVKVESDPSDMGSLSEVPDSEKPQDAPYAPVKRNRGGNLPKEALYDGGDPLYMRKRDHPPKVPVPEYLLSKE